MKTKKPTLKAKSVCFNNECGGTEMAHDYPELKGVIWEFQIVRIWHDYECGIRMVGRLASPKQIDMIRKAARSEYASDEKKARHDPSVVYVSEFDLHGDIDKGKALTALRDGDR